MTTTARISACSVLVLLLFTLLALITIRKVPLVMDAAGILLVSIAVLVVILVALYRKSASPKLQRFAAVLSGLWVVYGLAALAFALSGYAGPVRRPLALILFMGATYVIPGIVWSTDLRRQSRIADRAGAA